MTADDRALLTPGEVAQLFGVDPKTVTRWANEGQLSVVRTLGGHRRFQREDVMRALKGHLDATPETGNGE